MSQIRLLTVKHCMYTVIYAATYITHSLIQLFMVKYCIYTVAYTCGYKSCITDFCTVLHCGERR